jgi:hypothetical protein
MICRRLLTAFAALTLGAAAWAQPPADTAVTFGNKLSVSSITSAIQTAGYQALVAPRPPNLPDVIIGVISTGMNGAKSSVLVTKCDNSKTDDVCTLTLIVSFTDDKNILTDALLTSINTKLVYAKVTRIIRTTDNKPMMNVSYSYIVKDFTDTKFVAPLLAGFGADLGRVSAAYTAAAQPAQPPAK